MLQGKQIQNLTLIIGIIFAILFSTSLSFGSSENIANGLNWLLINQNPDGSWGSEADLAVLDTSTVLDTLKLLDIIDSAYSNGITWLDSQSSVSTDFISRKLASLYMAGTDVSDDFSTLLNIQNSDGGWGGDYGYESTIIDTSLSLLALQSVNYSDQTVIYRALNYLLSTQNSDGGWGFFGDHTSNVYATSLVSRTLQQFSQTPSIGMAINNASVYIMNYQQTDGSWGNIYETAHAYIALVGVSTDATILGSAIDYLTTTQLTNGSWNDNAYSTALALRSLKKFEDNNKPNLKVLDSSITISPPYPVEGQTVSIGCTVENTGTIAAADVAVNFYLGDPENSGELIGSNLIPLVESSGSAYTEITWVVDEVGDNDIYVFADPDNVIDEVSEEDNIAFTSITAASKPDLVIAGSDISFDNTSPLAGEYFTLTANIHNLGEGAIGHVTVAVYDGDPQASGAKLTGDGVGPS